MVALDGLPMEVRPEGLSERALHGLLHQKPCENSFNLLHQVPCEKPFSSGDQKVHGVRSAETVVICLQLSMEVEGVAAKVAHVVLQSMHALWPSEVASALERGLSCHYLPSATEIEEQRFALGVAIVLQHAQACRGHDMVRYLWADSGPHRGRHWFWIQEHFVRRSELLRLVADAWVLTESLGRLRALDVCYKDADFQVPRLIHLASSLEQGVRHFVHLPTILGSRRAGTIDKAAAMAHALAV